MKFHRFLIPVVLMGLSNTAFAASDAQKSFENLKTLAGSWQGTYDGKPVEISLCVTSMGNTLMHEVRLGGRLETRSPCFTSTRSVGRRIIVTQEIGPVWRPG